MSGIQEFSSGFAGLPFFTAGSSGSGLRATLCFLAFPFLPPWVYFPRGGFNLLPDSGLFKVLGLRVQAAMVLVPRSPWWADLSSLSFCFWEALVQVQVLDLGSLTLFLSFAEAFTGCGTSGEMVSSGTVLMVSPLPSYQIAVFSWSFEHFLCVGMIFDMVLAACPFFE